MTSAAAILLLKYGKSFSQAGCGFALRTGMTNCMQRARRGSWLDMSHSKYLMDIGFLLGKVLVTALPEGPLSPLLRVL